MSPLAFAASFVRVVSSFHGPFPVAQFVRKEFGTRGENIFVLVGSALMEGLPWLGKVLLNDREPRALVTGVSFSSEVRFNRSNAEEITAEK